MYGQAGDARHLYGEKDRLEKENAELRGQIRGHLKTIESLNTLVKQQKKELEKCKWGLCDNVTPY